MTNECTQELPEKCAADVGTIYAMLTSVATAAGRFAPGKTDAVDANR